MDKGKKIVSQSSRKGLKSLSVLLARAEKDYHSGIPRGGSKNKPKDDYESMSFRNSTIDRIKKGKTSRK